MDNDKTENRKEYPDIYFYNLAEFLFKTAELWFLLYECLHNFVFWIFEKVSTQLF